MQYGCNIANRISLNSKQTLSSYAEFPGYASSTHRSPIGLCKS